MRKLLSFLTVVLIAISLTVPANAAGSVTYDGKANTFIFAPGTKESPTNLFGNFQNVMPGDTRTEQIVIRNDASRGVKIKVYLRSLGAQAGTEDFLSQLKLTVQDKEDSILFEAPANETAQLSQWCYLGTVYSGGEIPLDVTLEVPVTMGDEFQNSVGYLDWEFKVEEFPTEPSDPRSPQTGDAHHVAQYLFLMLLSFAALIGLLFGRKRVQKKQQ